MNGFTVLTKYADKHLLLQNYSSFQFKNPLFGKTDFSKKKNANISYSFVFQPEKNHPLDNWNSTEYKSINMSPIVPLINGV